ncbi:MAG: 3-isopropylmalate/(R)-2-methylmalate dehydratase small subunit [Algoriphagus sp.]
MSADFADKLFSAIASNPETEIEIDLASQKITLLSTGESESFDINEYKKENMKHGFDDIDYLLNMSSEIDVFVEDN